MRGSGLGADIDTLVGVAELERETVDGVQAANAVAARRVGASKVRGMRIGSNTIVDFLGTGLDGDVHQKVRARDARRYSIRAREPACCGVGGATNLCERISYECASPNSRASLPGSPTNEMLPAGIPSAPMPVGTETSGRPSQFPYPSVVRMSGHGSTTRGAGNGIVG